MSLHYPTLLRILFVNIAGPNWKCEHHEAGNTAAQFGDQTVSAGQRYTDGVVAGRGSKNLF